MLQKRLRLIPLSAVLLALLVAGGVIFALERGRTAASEPATQTALASTANASVLQGMEATVYKSPTCGCCTGYVEFLEKHGVTVNAVDTNDLTQVKADYGVPYAAQSCHTTMIDGYVIEGHVPLAALEQFLTERPDVDGIALPGMPIGTPGMPGPKQAPYEVLSVDDGQLELYASF